MWLISLVMESAIQLWWRLIPKTLTRYWNSNLKIPSSCRWITRRKNTPFILLIILITRRKPYQVIKYPFIFAFNLPYLTTLVSFQPIIFELQKKMLMHYPSNKFKLYQKLLRPFLSLYFVSILAISLISCWNGLL